MPERHVTVTTSDGEIPSFLATPEGGTPVSAVIFYMDAPGFRDELCDMARRVAAAGYVCLLPDLYYRIGTIRLEMGYLRKEPTAMTVMRACRNTLTNAMLMADTAAMLEFLDAQPEVEAGSATGAIGHCMSGRFVVSAAGTYPDRMQAVASLYGVQIVTDEADSPHLLADKIQGELYLAFAEHDDYVPAGVVPTLEKVLHEAAVEHTIITYPGTEHGFCFPGRDIYAHEAAEQTWTDILAMLGRRLVRAG